MTRVSMDDRVSDFIARCRSVMESHGVDVRLPDSDLLEVAVGELCSGYFEDTDPENPVFAVATGRSQEVWFPIFVHEFCHFEQWRDRRGWWDTFKLEDGREYLDHLLEHFAGERDLTPEQVVCYARRQAEVEIDCERRVLRKVEEHGLPIDLEGYARSANSYITYYYAMPALRGWCNGERPYEVPEIVDAMPSHLDLTDEDYEKLANDLLEVYRERCLHPPR